MRFNQGLPLLDCSGLTSDIRQFLLVVRMTILEPKEGQENFFFWMGVRRDMMVRIWEWNELCCCSISIKSCSNVPSFPFFVFCLVIVKRQTKTSKFSRADERWNPSDRLALKNCLRDMIGQILREPICYRLSSVIYHFSGNKYGNMGFQLQKGEKFLKKSTYGNMVINMEINGVAYGPEKPYSQEYFPITMRFVSIVHSQHSSNLLFHPPNKHTIFLCSQKH